MPKFPKDNSNISSITTSTTFYTCDFTNCNREFNSKRNLVDHCRGHHEGKKPHLCSFPGCGKSFLRPAHLLIHNRIHTGEKPFICEYEGCGKRWNQKSALKQHIRSHTGEKPFHCHVADCTKTFSTSSSCKRHISTHFGSNNNNSNNNSNHISGNNTPSSPISSSPIHNIIIPNEELLFLSRSNSNNSSEVSSPSMSPTMSPSMSPTSVQYWNGPFSFDSPSSSSDEEFDTELFSNFANSFLNHNNNHHQHHHHHRYQGSNHHFNSSANILLTPKMTLNFLLN